MTTLFAVWPVIIMALEGAQIDLSPLFSGKGIRFVGGVPYYSGGIYPSLIHYTDALTIGEFPRLMLNSTTIAMLSIAIALVIGVPAAYALARLEFKGKSAFAFLLLALRMVSPFALILPLYLIYVHNGLWDTYPGLALAYLIIILPVTVWLLKGFISDIPRDIYEAAGLFGASERQIFWRIVFPSILPAIVITAIFAFVLVWNEFLIADILTGPVTKTISVGVWSGSGPSFKTVDWDDLNAAGTLAAVPAICMVLLIRKYLAKGFSLATAR